MQTRAYLNFTGDCQEAIELYSKAFNTQADKILRFKDAPPAPSPDIIISEEKRDYILQATLPIGGTFIRMSDTLGELEAPYSERIMMAVEGTELEIARAFKTLSEAGGEVAMPLESTFFSPCFGMVIDRYKVLWNLFASYPEQQ